MYKPYPTLFVGDPRKAGKFPLMGPEDRGDWTAVKPEDGSCAATVKTPNSSIMWSCTLPKNHSGPHVATAGKIVCARWLDFYVIEEELSLEDG